MKKFLLTFAALLFAATAHAHCTTLTGGGPNQPTRIEQQKTTIFPFRDIHFSVQRVSGDGTLGSYELLGSLTVPPIGQFSLGVVTATEDADQDFFGIDEPYVTIKVNTPPAPGTTAKVCFEEHQVLQTVAKLTTHDNTHHDILTVPLPVGSSYYMEFRVNGIQTTAGDLGAVGDRESGLCFMSAFRVDPDEGEFHGCVISIGNLFAGGPGPGGDKDLDQHFVTVTVVDHVLHFAVGSQTDGGNRDIQWVVVPFLFHQRVATP